MKILYPKDYPECLRQIALVPTQLYYEGNVALLGQPAVAVVGSRASTTYGERACTQLATGLVRAGIVIVSGLAIGIDTVAHRAALGAYGQTIAVLGNGLDSAVFFPKTNRKLARQIVAQGGLLLTEYPADTPARAGQFPARNRIIAGLSLGTLVVEAAQKSGALITAHLALDCNREVFAVPGSIFSSRSLGTNRLLQQGALPVCAVNDILRTLDMAPLDAVGNPTATAVRHNHKFNPIQRALLQELQNENLSAEQLVQRTAFSALDIMTNLTELEIPGIVRKNRDQNYETSYC